MRFTRRARLVFGWFASLAILLGALAPTVTHALPRGAAGGWVTVCTAIGMKIVKLDAAGQVDAGSEQAAGPMDAGSPSAHDGAHCAYCVGGSLPPGLPAAVPAAWAAPEGFAPRPPLYWSAPRPLAVWASAQPRGPPRQG